MFGAPFIFAFSRTHIDVSRQISLSLKRKNVSYFPSVESKNFPLLEEKFFLYVLTVIEMKPMMQAASKVLAVLPLLEIAHQKYREYLPYPSRS